MNKENQTGVKPAIDWEAVEPHYRSGIRSLKDIGLEYGVSAPAILKRAKRDGWSRDLGAKIRAKADAKVNAALVNDLVNPIKVVNENAVVEANAEVQYRIRIEQRTDIQRVKGLLKMLLAEAEKASENLGPYVDLGELLDESGPDATGTWRKDKINEAYRKAISLPSRVGILKQITETLALLIKLERQAFGIDDTDGDREGVEERLVRLGRIGL